MTRFLQRVSRLLRHNHGTAVALVRPRRVPPSTRSPNSDGKTNEQYVQAVLVDESGAFSAVVVSLEVLEHPRKEQVSSSQDVDPLERTHPCFRVPDDLPARRGRREARR